uniref:Solute carrier family 13 member 2 n=1 Tax=Denticeps clupeoides TaxID=299321 RepID=A0A8C4CPP0_9TELE
MDGFMKWLWSHRNYLIIFLTPILFLPLPLIIPRPEAKCGFAIIVMAVYWCTECLPLAVTALLPVILFPMMGIMESGEVCVQYLKDSNMLFIGGLLVAIAVENWNLHKRIALKVLLLVGVRPALLMMGFMVVTAFLSMWISNTATTAMMLPIAQAILAQLSATEAEADELELRGGHNNHAFQLEDVSESKPPLEKFESTCFPSLTSLKPKYLLLAKGMSLCVCYSASIGGTATLTGTTPNLILKVLNFSCSIYPQNNDIINFASWFGFAFPNMVLMLVLAWLWLQFMYLAFRAGDLQGNEEYRKLGHMTFAEGAVLCIFVLLVVLWFTREPGFMPGWASVFNGSGQYVTDGTVAIFMSMLFFIIPSRFPQFSFSSGRDGKDRFPECGVCATWSVVHERMPWNIILLLGGGFALASGSEESGLSVWLGQCLVPLKSIPPFAISIILCLLVGTFTECSSNTATTTLFLPILASMATAIELHPLYIMLPCTISASLAFMLPVATPPNAIAFSYGQLKVMDMAKAGCALNIIGILTINLAINTWGKAMFHLDTFPDWARNTTRAS